MSPNTVEPRKSRAPRIVLPEPVDEPVPHAEPLTATKNQRDGMITLLNQRLAEAVDLQMQMKQAHWNVKGPNFLGLRSLFGQLNAAVVSYVEQIAERIVALGGIAEGTVRVSAARSRLADYPLTICDGSMHAAAVGQCLSTFRHEIVNTIGEADELDDAPTADLFSSIAGGLDRWVWQIEALGQTAN